MTLKQLRYIKSYRCEQCQYCGDAEMFFHSMSTETRVRQAANTGKRGPRAICNILEGGEQAFEQRYKRIHLGD